MMAPLPLGVFSVTTWENLITIGAANAFVYIVSAAISSRVLDITLSMKLLQQNGIEDPERSGVVLVKNISLVNYQLSMV